MSKTCCIFLGAAMPKNQSFIEATKSIGPLFKKHKINLIYGGASRGLMGILADAAINAGVHTTGVMSDDLADVEITHPNLNGLYNTQNIHQRKDKMIALSDFFIALPGGIGTYEELFTTWCHIKIHKQNKKIGLLNIEGFFDSICQSIERMANESFITSHDKNLLLCHDDAEKLILQLMECS